MAEKKKYSVRICFNRNLKINSSSNRNAKFSSKKQTVVLFTNILPQYTKTFAPSCRVTVLARSQNMHSAGIYILPRALTVIASVDTATCTRSQISDRLLVAQAIYPTVPTRPKTPLHLQRASRAVPVGRPANAPLPLRSLPPVQHHTCIPRLMFKHRTLLCGALCWFNDGTCADRLYDAEKRTKTIVVCAYNMTRNHCILQ